MHCNARSRPFLDLKITVGSNLKFNVQLVPVFPLDVLLEHPEGKYLVRAAAKCTSIKKKMIQMLCYLRAQ